MKTLFQDVGDFHSKFKLPRARAHAEGDKAPALPSEEVYLYRFRFLHEELTEFSQAFMHDDLAGMADALVDLVYVALGTAHYMGLPFDQLWDEVQRANMAKVLKTAETPGSHKRGEVEVIRKPFGWEPPNIDGVLQQEAEWHGGKV